jgi:hypothetical protein
MIRTTIQPHDVFDRAGLEAALGLKTFTIQREILLGRLKAYRRSRSTYFLGEDVLDWLRAGEVRPDQLPDDETDT